MKGSEMTIERLKSLMQTALGKEPADMAVVNAALFNVFTGEVIPESAVCVKDGRIAFVGKNPGRAIGDTTQVIDAAGRTVIPGLIDAHTHIAWMFSPGPFLDAAMAGGTTTIVTEIYEPYFVAGYAGVLELLESMADQPVKIYTVAPAMVSISRRCRGIAPTDLERLLTRDDILGLGESYWQGVLQDPDAYLPAFIQTLAARKAVEGHSAGANEKNLNAYAAAGVSSCHEPIQAAEVLDRLRLGMHVMIREGSVRRELEAVSKIVETGVDLRRAVLVSDGISPEAVIRDGYMEFVVQKAIQLGFAPADAIRMATINAAEHFGLAGLIGAIAPGRMADMVIIPDLKTIQPEIVISNGRVIAENGQLLAPARHHQFSEASRQTIRLPKDLPPDAFAVRAPGGSDAAANVNVIELITELVTRRREYPLPVINGNITADFQNDICKVAAIDRAVIPGEMFCGFVQGCGLNSGAIATSAAWDSADIIVIGANDADMALAVNRIRELQGGIVVAENNKVRAELPLPIFGVISDQPADVIAGQTRHICQVLNTMGMTLSDPLLTLGTLTTAAIPFFRICEEGLYDFKTGSTMGLIAGE
jgi:adenine deaminase